MLVILQMKPPFSNESTNTLGFLYNRGEINRLKSTINTKKMHKKEGKKKKKRKSQGKRGEKVRTRRRLGDSAIQWRFGDAETPIAEFGCKMAKETRDLRYKEKLKKNKKQNALRLFQ